MATKEKWGNMDLFKAKAPTLRWDQGGRFTPPLPEANGARVRKHCRLLRQPTGVRDE